MTLTLKLTTTLEVSVNSIIAVSVILAESVVALTLVSVITTMIIGVFKFNDNLLFVQINLCNHIINYNN